MGKFGQDARVTPLLS